MMNLSERKGRIIDTKKLLGLKFDKSIMIVHTEKIAIQHVKDHLQVFLLKYEVLPGEKRLVQQSTFLPSLADKVLRSRKSHQRSYTYVHPDESDENSFQADAMNYLRDCETILENLKRLTKNSTKRVSSTKKQSNVKNDLSMRGSLKIQQQTSFYPSSQNNQSLALKPNRLLKGRNEKEIEQSDHSDYDQSHRARDSQMKKAQRKSREDLQHDFLLKRKTDSNLLVHNNCNNKVQIKSVQQQKSVQTKITLKDDQNEISSTTNFVSLKKNQENELFKVSKPKNVNIKEYSVQKINTNDNSHDSNSVIQNSFCQKVNQNINDQQPRKPEVQQENKMKDRNGSSPQQRKQRFLVQLLNKANTRGMELHKRIMEHKLKNKGSINCFSNLGVNSKEKKESLKKEENRNRQQEVQGKKRSEHLNSTKSTQREREGDMLSNTKASKFEQKILTESKNQNCRDKDSDDDESEESQLDQQQGNKKKQQKQLNLKSQKM